MSYNVLIVEDQRMPRQLLELFVKESGRYELSGSIASAELALTFCRRRTIDLILMDVLTEFGVSGLDTAEEIKKEFPGIKIIIITSMPEASWLKRARDIGVDSFWYKEAEGASILEVMDATMEGESIYPDSPPRVSIGNTSNRDFTDRELDVLREMLTGDSNTKIAERLGISENTVKFHIQSMLQKTGFHSRTELVAQARSLGIVIK